MQPELAAGSDLGVGSNGSFGAAGGSFLFTVTSTCLMCSKILPEWEACAAAAPAPGSPAVRGKCPLLQFSSER